MSEKGEFEYTGKKIPFNGVCMEGRAGAGGGEANPTRGYEYALSELKGGARRHASVATTKRQHNLQVGTLQLRTLRGSSVYWMGWFGV